MTESNGQANGHSNYNKLLIAFRYVGADVFIREDDAGNETIAYIDDVIKELEQLERDLGDEPTSDT
jgi:hypothetical protein